MLLNPINYKNLIKNKKILFLFVVAIFLFYLFFISAPFKKEGSTIHIKSGDSFNDVSIELKEKNIIRSPIILKIFFKILNKNGFSEGDYYFDRNVPVYKVAWQLAYDKHNIQPIKIILREGLTNEEFALVLSKNILNFDEELFLDKTENLQGYLFPDTYFIFPHSSVDEIIGKLSKNFENKIKNINKENIKLDDIIIMASILEGEANGKDDAPIISGILWKRLKMGMRLQVDIDPNTYKESGLPSKPLNNPGISSIISAVNPIDSDYLYYLHDKDGNVHYSKTYDDHRKNINKYLK